MLELEFDHIIHYVDDLKHLAFPGHVVSIEEGGSHEKMGTYNKLSYTDLKYIEYLSIENKDTFNKLLKSKEGNLSFASSINYRENKQGFKKICLRTNDIDTLAMSFKQKGIKVFGPVDMSRVNKRGKELKWRLLYIDQFKFKGLTPFFIEWDQSKAQREEALSQFFQPQFSFESIIINTTKRDELVSDWIDWFDFKHIATDDNKTVLRMNHSDLTFIIRDNKENYIESVVLSDKETTQPYQIRIKGGHYRFEPIDKFT